MILQNAQEISEIKALLEISVTYLKCAKKNWIIQKINKICYPC